MRLNLTLLTILLLFCGCSESSDKFIVGVSQHKGGPWNQQLQRELEREALYYDDIELKFTNAKNDPARQTKQINGFIEDGVDLLIITPSDDIELIPAIDNAAESGIPTIMAFTQTRSKSYTASVTFDNFNIGRAAGLYVAENLSGKGNIVELCGEDRDIAAIDIHSGFKNELAKHPQISRMTFSNINWDKQVAQQIVDSLLRGGLDIDMLFAHNDIMAYGASLAAENLNLSDSMKFVGIGGLSGEKQGLGLVSAGIIDASFMQPTAGDIIMETAHKILMGEPFERDRKLPTAIITKANAEIANMQEVQADLLDDRIKSLKVRILNHKKRDVMQRSLLLTAIGVVLLILGILYVIHRSLRIKEQMNSCLQKSNDEIRSLSQQLEAATNSKLSFFTNISHELCTPLTLIAEPINSILKEPNIESAQRNSLLHIAQHNASILLRLVKQILDFQRYESGMAQLNISSSNLREIIAICNRDFAPAFRQRGLSINCVEAEGMEYDMDLDRDKIEQVYYNLLSNSLKYFRATSDSKTVDISLSNELRDGVKYAVVSVTNENPDVTEELVANIFERFYKIDNASNGSGIGLTLSKSYVEMHGGDLTAKCLDGGRVRFTLSLPIVNGSESTHTPSEMERQNLYIEQPIDLNLRVASGDDSDRKVILIVDDNDEIREFVAYLLQDRFSLLFAANGKEGLEVAMAQIPDLIISDIMMPEMDGVAMCSQLKKEFATSHIPILMLTACNLDEQRIEGFLSGADSYISKPFNSALLLVRVDNLLENRARLVKESNISISEISDNAAPESVDSLTTEEREFMTKFRDLIEANISNSEFNVEGMYSHLNLSRVQLYRKIRALTDMSPNEILRIERLKRGDTLLRTSSKTMAEIAYEVGFSAPSYFSKCYKEHYGVAPTEVR